MASTVVDLTGDSSDVGSPRENAWAKNSIAIANMSQFNRRPLVDVQNGASKAAPSVVSDALENAINSVDADRFRVLVKYFCQSNALLREQLGIRLLVQGKDVVRYHEDTGSEDASEQEEEEEEEDDDDDSDSGPTRKLAQLHPIILGNDDMTARFAKCDNCNEEFDVSSNIKGDCRWHPGEKELKSDSDFWADHDWDCHGDPHDFVDDPNYGAGFMWSCCDRTGDEEECKSTKHKAKVNVITHPAPVVAPIPVPQQAKKRKVAEDLQRPVYARCANCNMRYDMNENGIDGCSYHPGRKVVNFDSDTWDDHDERCHGSMKGLINDPTYINGFKWTCCGDAGGEAGCKKLKRHVGVQRI